MSTIRRQRIHAGWLARAMALLSLGLVLFAAQTIVFVHDVDPDSHVPGHVCDICVASAQLSDGAVAGATMLIVPAASHVLAAAAPSLHVECLAFAPSARGPPIAS